MSGTTEIQNLEQARQHAARTACAGCGKRMLSASEVRKEGPNRGRLFVKCRHCGHFDWLTAAAQRDEELERVQAKAGPCPKCGKGRRAQRVNKEGPNKCRLFLACADPACDRFEWASPAAGPRPEPAPRPVVTEGQRTEEGLLACIRDNFDDDAPRLIYADWLDEHGEPLRAELIRVQTELARLAPDDPARPPLDQRARAILAEQGERWTAPLRPFVMRYQYVRGLIDEVEIEVAKFAEHADEVLRLAPTATLCVHLGGWQGVLALVRCRQLRRVRRLTLLGGHLGGSGAGILATSSHLANLRALSLPGLSLGLPGTQALAGSRYLANLEVLDLTANSLSRSTVPVLAGSPNLPRLRRLVLANNLLDDSDVRALANSQHLTELRELDLSGNDGITTEGIESLARSPLLARLRRLNLTGCPVGERGVYLLRQSPHAGKDLVVCR